MTISHITQRNGAWAIQENADHQHGVAELAGKFATAFGMQSWGYALGIMHDKGKERQAFQCHIKRESGYDPTARTTENHTHAWIGGALARRLFGKTADIFLTDPIISHHTGLHDTDDIEDIVSKLVPKEVDMNVEKPKLDKPALTSAPQARDLHHITRMLFSCLVDADYLDTEAFMQPRQARLRGCKRPLPELADMLDVYLRRLQTAACATPVNAIRREVQERCRATAAAPQGFYSLTVPTGGGKTLSSLLWAMRHAVRHNLRRVIIAIPYTSIVTQTAATLKGIFGEDNVLEHHSSFRPEEISDERTRERIRLATENWDYPVVVTTNVQLFESMFAAKPSTCRKLHNIAQSVIILDEAQTLPVEFLQPIVDTLTTYQRLFHVSVLLTTASQPVLTGRIEGCNPRCSFSGIDRVTEIIPAELRLHDRLRRTRLSIDNHPTTYDDIARKLTSHRRVLCIVNTRRDARELFTRLPDEGLTLHLSRMMCPSHIRATIARIKETLARDDGTVIRVVATQLIEAGVDIDFPVVFRQEAGLDSVLQAAGRCNREGRLPLATTYVFSLAKERPLPRGRMQNANNARLSLHESSDWFSPEAMSEYFRQLYCREETFDKHKMAELLYKKDIQFAGAAHEFRLIDDTGYNIIVNHGDSPELVEELKTDGPSYGLMRRLGQYTVSLHKQDFQKLIECGAVEMPIEGVYFVADKQQYDQRVGLSTDNHWQEELLMA